MRDHGNTLTFAPRLPRQLERLSFRLLYRGRKLRVDVRTGDARYELLTGSPVDLVHHGDAFTLTTDAPRVLTSPPTPVRPDVAEPPGRTPRRP